MGDALGKAEAQKEAPSPSPAACRASGPTLPAVPLRASGFPEGRDQPHPTLSPRACHRGKATLKHKLLVLAI